MAARGRGGADSAAVSDEEAARDPNEKSRSGERARGRRPRAEAKQDPLAERDPWSGMAAQRGRPSGEPPGPAAGGSSGSAGAVVQKHMDALSEKIREYMAEQFTTAMDSVREELDAMVEDKLAPQAARLEEHATEIAQIKEKNANLEKEQAGLQAAVKELQTTLAVAEAQVAAPLGPARLADWNRTADPALFVLSCQAPAAPGEVKSAISQWLQAAKVTEDQVTLLGDLPSKRFHLHCPGGAAGVARAGALQAALKLPGGQWRRFDVLSVNGQRVTMYTNADKSAKDIRKEVQTKKLLGLIRAAVPSKDCWARRPKGLVYVDSVPIVEVQVRGPDEASRLAWDGSATARLGIDKQAITNQFQALWREVGAATRGLSVVTWNVRGLLLRAAARRRRKVNMVVEHLRQRSIVLVQEVHGFTETLQNYLNQYSIHYKMYSSTTGRPGAGGIAILIPWHDHRTIAAAGTAALPQIQSRELEPGRAAVTTITNPKTQRAIKIMNIHNYDLTELGKDRIRRAWRDAAHWAHEDPMKRTFVAAGDFNMTDVPAESLLYPRPRQAQRSDASRANRSEPFWRDIFANPNMLEVCSPLPTHFTKDSGTLRTIDRIFVSLASSFALETECDLQLVHDAVTLDAQNLGDHAILKLRMKTRQATPKGERKIPGFIFKSPEYKRILANCLDGCRIEFKPVFEQWRDIKAMMTLAAELARNELQSKALVVDSDSGRHARLLTLNSVARAVWRQDARLARRLMHDTPIGAAELELVDGTVQLKRLGDFHTHVREAQAQLLGRETAALVDSASGTRRRTAEVMIKRALLWNPTKRALVLSGIRHAQPAGQG
ncbi:unnamed protein product, partial [Prorocentrum cordatum]